MPLVDPHDDRGASAPAPRFDFPEQIACSGLLLLAAELLNASGVLFAVRDGEDLVSVEGEPLPPALLPGCRAVVETGDPVCVEKGSASGSDAFLGVPILGEHGDVLGALSVQATAPRSWSTRDLQVLQHLAGLAAAELDWCHRGVHFRSIFQHAAFGILVLDLDGRFIDYNPAVERKLGYGRTGLRGTALEEIAHPEDHAAIARIRGELLAGSQAHRTVELRLRHRDAHYVWVRLGFSVARGLTGDARYLIVVGYDISQQRQSEAALRESEERFRSVVENLGEGLVITDLDDVILYANSRMLQLTGFAPEELIGKVAYEVLLPRDEQHKVERELKKRSRGLPGRYEVQLERKDGTRLWLEVHGVPYRTRDGEIIGTLGLAEDITERKRAVAALRESEERYRLVVESVHEVIFQTDMDGRWTFLNPAWEELTGYSVDESLGQPLLNFVHPEDREGSSAADGALSPRGPEPGRHEVRCLTRSGEIRWMEVQARPLMAADGTPLGTTGTLRDMTERRRAEKENERLAALSRENPYPVLQCDAQGNPVHVNPAAERIWRDLGLQDARELLPGDHVEHVRNCLREGEGRENVEARIGSRVFAWSYRPHPGTETVYMFAVDITGRRLMEEQLRHEALHDALTGLPNRLLFMERLSHALMRAKRRDDYQFAVLFLDLDRFKVINDSLGHHVGDELLTVVARRLQACLRTGDTVARLGGDEFAILLEELGGVGEATRVVRRIQAELAVQVNLSGFDVYTSASVGIAVSSGAHERPEHLLRNADMAMYRAKAMGQARFEVFDREMHAQALTRLQLETDLRQALDRGEFLVHFQPIVALETGRLKGVEALLRWAHPKRGWMAPDDFIPVAEETGIILPLGEWVMQEGCRQFAAWRKQFPGAESLSLAVNLSAKQLSQSDLVEKIRHTLEVHDLPASALRLEITESAIMDNADAAALLLNRLKRLGVRISLDDFGTGYSSLSYLHRFPLDALKIDRSFVGRMHEDERSAQLVQTILTLTRSLGLTAVAEGIESKAQLLALRAMGCALGQGYFFSKPLTSEQMEHLLRAPSPFATPSLPPTG